MNQKKLVELLQKESIHQHKLQESRILPTGMDPLMQFVAKYPWQMLLISSLAVNLMLFFADACS